jgi:hypothetical protein
MEVKRTPYRFPVNNRPVSDLPGFRILRFFVVVLVVVFFIVLVVKLVVDVLVEIVFVVRELCRGFLGIIAGIIGFLPVGRHVVGSVAGFGFGGAGGGYVVQKCRPHCGHTQN